MGKRGPKPVPTALLKMRGSWRAETRLDEPEYTRDIPAPPAFLRKRAQDYWPEIADMLHSIGVMSYTFSIALSMLVDALADWIHWTKECENPRAGRLEWSEKDKAFNRLKQMCDRFGMNPSAISSVKSVQKADEAPQGIAALKLAT
jgi:phage terminase small subunit